MMAAAYGRTEVVSLLLEAGANTDLQNKVVSCMRGCGGSTVWGVHHLAVLMV